MQSKKTAIILTNLGTPADNTVPAVRKFLKQFLSDQRVIEIPKPIWWLILNGIILPFRARSALKGYDSIWTEEGSPLLAISRRQQQQLQKLFDQQGLDDVKVDLMMRYGEPSFASVTRRLLADGYQKLVLLPLYPQNSATTTATTLDHLATTLRTTRAMPELHFINEYHGHPDYIHALATSIQEHWRSQQRQRFLLMSFHGLPQRNVDKGDPYYDQCMGSAHLLATILGLGSDQWALSFQSRFGKQEWIKPYTSETLAMMADKGLKEVDVVCPGFSVDCLETLEEIQVENRDVFIEHGGEQYHYIPCLNEREDHITMMMNLVRPYLEV